MYEKFSDIFDEDLIALVKNGDIDAENELLGRYRTEANKLGRRFYHQFRNSINCESEDLILVALNAVLIAVRSYTKGGNFKIYWQKIASHEIMKVIKETSNSFKCDGKYTFVQYNEDLDQSEYFSSREVEDDVFHTFVKFVYSSKIDEDNLSKELFIEHLKGKSIKVIAHQFHLKEHIVRYKVDCVKKKINKKILHS